MPIHISTIHTFACKHCKGTVSGEDEQIVIKKVEACEAKGEPVFEFEIGDEMVFYPHNSKQYHSGIVERRLMETGTHVPLYEVLIDGQYTTFAHREEIIVGNLGNMITMGLRFPVGARSGK